MVKFTKLEQFWKEDVFIAVIVDGSVTVVRLVQFRKVDDPIDVTLDGILILVRPVHP